MLDKLSYLNSIGAPEGHGEVTITPDTYVHKEEEEDEDDEPMGDPSNSEYTSSPLEEESKYRPSQKQQ